MAVDKFEGFKRILEEGTGGSRKNRQEAPPASTNEPEPAPEAAPAEPEPPAEATATEPQNDEGQQVPYERFKDVNEKFRASEAEARQHAERAAQVEQELAKLREEIESAKRERDRQNVLHGERPDGWEEMSSEQQTLWLIEQTTTAPDTSKLAELEKRYESAIADQYRREVSQATGVTDPEALDALLDMGGKFPNLPTDAVVNMAKTAFPNLSWPAATSSEPATVPASHVGAVPARSATGRSTSPASKRTDAFQAMRANPRDKKASAEALKHILK